MKVLGRVFLMGVGILTVVLLNSSVDSAAMVGIVAAAGAQDAGAQQWTQADIEDWFKELSNWGRWGREDQLGALNLITPAKRRQAAALVKKGFSVSLGRDADTEKAVDNPSPYSHVMQLDPPCCSDRLGGQLPRICTHAHRCAQSSVSPRAVFQWILASRGDQERGG